jgi:hypothetical protein
MSESEVDNNPSEMIPDKFGCILSSGCLLFFVSCRKINTGHSSGVSEELKENKILVGIGLVLIFLCQTSD